MKKISGKILKLILLTISAFVVSSVALAEKIKVKTTWFTPAIVNKRDAGCLTYSSGTLTMATCGDAKVRLFSGNNLQQIYLGSGYSGKDKQCLTKWDGDFDIHFAPCEYPEGGEFTP